MPSHSRNLIVSGLPQQSYNSRSFGSIYMFVVKGGPCDIGYTVCVQTGPMGRILRLCFISKALR